MLVKKTHLIRSLVLGSIIILFVYFSSQTESVISLTKEDVKDVGLGVEVSVPEVKQVVEEQAPVETKLYDTIMPMMPDLETKQELGRVSWKYFHTVLARFPERPTMEQRDKLKEFITLYAELYPCGECSYHFVKLISKYPVQTSSRIAASMWGCHVHNMVNEYLKKDEYDCSTILEDYDCGCGSDEGTRESQMSIENEDRQLGG
ncbi:hypothetical protein TBLA_0I00800 [Henningerozyma blattae CBS 6284]|uniref:Sulfhydryl oxidase n=1 Tax=Henningerozyma blattae (strain ATCC 34711 / CBS 6284 / DSM 70876 / NBRC 10599 / NRRL Y-10934 / UCD 77-7) TaxID=1071380 RepID=I2H8N7_HENB6|nr:hypothetical protein TBLA_0I00800 [Tetrapisispora blattae CBS 6284]CCH62739.1 hypothetical protein TBLA_0I00800 [Tetrapisispora blattae CBS 6284]